MRPPSFALFLSLTPLALLAQVEHQHHPPRSAAEYAKVLEDPSRDAWQKPHEVMQALALKSTDAVADIGAGSGYFSRRFARHAAKVYAVDIDAELLKRAAGEKIETVHAKPNDPLLPAASLDVIFICDVLHHIDQRPAYYAKLAQALKPEGRIVIVDFYKKPLPVGPPPGMKLAEDQVKQELAAAGFTLTKSHGFLPHQYFLEFSRAR